MSKSALRIIWTKWRKWRDRLRSWWWSNICASYGKRSLMRGRISVYGPQELKIGSHSSINEGVVLNARGGLQIGDHVHVSTGVIINTIGLRYEQTNSDRAHGYQAVVIEDGVWIGSGAIINPGVTIGANSVIGAGSVVTKDIPSDSVAVGIPCRVIKSLG